MPGTTNRFSSILSPFGESVIDLPLRSRTLHIRNDNSINTRPVNFSYDLLSRYLRAKSSYSFASASSSGWQNKVSPITAFFLCLEDAPASLIDPDQDDNMLID